MFDTLFDIPKMVAEPWSAKKDIMKTTSYDQSEIIKNIITLYCPDGIECDSTYSIGNFYKNTGITPPKYKFDINPQADGVVEANATELPLPDASIQTYMFDPPFVCASSAKGIITKRFSHFKNGPELWEFYTAAIKEAYRILKPKGVFIFKCQDTVDSSKQYLSHVKIIMDAYKVGFYPKDMFVLLAENRIIGEHHKKQQHARKYHSYFLVFIKEESKVKYE